MQTLQALNETVLTEVLPTTARSQLTSGDDIPALYIQMVYEDTATGLRARQALDRLAFNLKLETDFHVDLLRFDFLWEPAFREQALEHAADADILLLSAHGQDGLPLVVSSWLAQWLARELGRPRALVLSFDEDASGSVAANRILASLQAAAQPAGVDVFPHWSQTLGTDWNVTIQGVQYRAETKTTLLDEALRQVEPHSHWGINE